MSQDNEPVLRGYGADPADGRSDAAASGGASGGSGSGVPVGGAASRESSAPSAGSSVSPSGSSAAGTGNSGSTVAAVKDEAASVARTGVDAAKDVGRTAGDEAGAVMEEAKDQLQDLYEQTRAELTDEAAKQQERISTGLRTVGDDLDAMARSSDDGGVARQLVRETSQRVSRAASWLGDREPGEVLEEVKAFARRQPGVFIGVAAIAGVVAGRLTRALAANASESGGGAGPSRPQGGGRIIPVDSERAGAGPSGADTAGAGVIPGAHGATEDLPGTVGQPAQGPAQTRASEPGMRGEAGTDDRPHAL